MRILRGLVFVIATVLSPAMQAHADIVHLNSGQKEPGKIVGFTRSEVELADDCGGRARKVAWDAIERLEFSDGCDGLVDPSLNSIPHSCLDEKFKVFVVTFKGGGAPVIAESAAIGSNGLFHLDTFEPWNQAHGGLDQVAQIAQVHVCRTDARRVANIPTSYCQEPRKVAVAFDYRTPLSNRILTNGFSFYVRISGNMPERFDLAAFGGEIRGAFQHGISLWTSALQERRQLLTEPISKFIEARISRSPSGYSMLIPPQVVELACPQSATFVVDVSFGNRSLFPRPPLVLAKAQTEGRTIALNVLDIGCYRTVFKFGVDKRLPFELEDGCFNLVPIMTHELGHAFGIRHIDDPERHALMDSRFSYDALVPTDRDAQEFIAVLGRSITGSAAGEIAMVTSEGVRPPAEYERCLEPVNGSRRLRCN